MTHKNWIAVASVSGGQEPRLFGGETAFLLSQMAQGDAIETLQK